jgi:hypothetical protein
MVDLSPRTLVWSARPWAAQTVAMAKRRPQTGKRAAKGTRQAPDVQPMLPGWTQEEVRAFLDPVAKMNPDQELIKALEAVGIDLAKACQPAALLRQSAGLLTARTAHSEQVALAVAHAEDARACRDGKYASENLRQDVLATLYLRRNLPLPSGLHDTRTPLIMDGECVALVQPSDDARSGLIAFKVPRVLVDRLRDAVHAMQPTRTMAGIVSLGIATVLDALESQVIRQTGKGFPKRPTKVLTGGRPSRTTATNAAKPPNRTKPSKRA